jgi:hypothetical protein
VINHPNLIREVLLTKGKTFRKWERQTRDNATGRAFTGGGSPWQPVAEKTPMKF